MVQKFNFYDVYGYFVPGITFIALLWLPFVLLRGKLPASDWSSAILAIVIGYVAGHILQTLALHAIPSKLKDKSRELRHPSDILLDKGDDGFILEFKRSLAQRILTRLAIDVDIDAKREMPEGQGAGKEHKEYLNLLSYRRHDAFLLCRSVLIQHEGASYSEQFEGMYALMRGLTASFGVAAFYHAGWALRGLLYPMSPSLYRGGVLLTFFSLLFTCLVALLAVTATSGKIGKQDWPWLKSLEDHAEKKSWLMSGLLALTMFLLGCIFGGNFVIGLKQSVVSGMIALTNAFITLRCFSAYKSFAIHFAQSVYRDFYAFDLCRQDQNH